MPHLCKVRNAKTPRPTMVDPTRTTMIRKKFIREVRQRLNVLKQRIIKLVDEDDVFGLKEQVENAQKFSSTQINLPQLLPLVQMVQEKIDSADVLKLEDEPHVTVRYGLHTTDPEDVKPLLRDNHNIPLQFGQLSLFQSEEHDVLKIDVESHELRIVNYLLGELPHTDTHEGYRPHLTIAYLKPGTGEKYLKLPCLLSGTEQIGERITFSTPDRDQTVVNIFCPTGPGGGVDPTCSPGGGGGGISSAGSLRVIVADNPSLYGKKLYAGDATQPSGSPVRGTPISPNDPSIPDTVYHMTSNLPAVEQSGVLRASGEGGLGGDKADQIVSMTIDRGIAEQLVSDTKLVASVAREHGNPPDRNWDGDQWVGDRTEWGQSVVDDLNKSTGEQVYAPSDLQLESYGFGDHLRQFFSARQTATGAKDPQFWDAENLASIDPDRVGLVEIPKENLQTGAMLTDFDLDNQFGLKEIRLYGDVPLERSVRNTRWKPLTSPQQLQAFREWLAEQLGATLLGGVRTIEEAERAYWQAYTEEGFRQGAGRAFQDVKPFIPGETSEFYRATREEFLRSAFGQPVAVERVQILAGRVFTDLKGISEVMSTTISRRLTDGLVRGEHPRTIAADLAKAVDISRARAETIARTETIRAHAEGQLTSFEMMGVQEVGVQAEWRTAGDDRVCPQCAQYEGQTFPIAESHGLIPLHPNCRCIWVTNIDALLKNSRAKVSNVFCPTGPGGGVDPTCSPGGAGGGATLGVSEGSFSSPVEAKEYGEQLGDKGDPPPSHRPDAVHVIGRLTVTSTLEAGDDRIVLKSERWTPEVNDGWVEAGIANRREFRFAHPITDTHLSREAFDEACQCLQMEPTVLARELQLLEEAGYVPVRDRAGQVTGMVHSSRYLLNRLGRYATRLVLNVSKAEQPKMQINLEEKVLEIIGAGSVSDQDAAYLRGYILKQGADVSIVKECYKLLKGIDDPRDLIMLRRQAEGR